MMKRKMLKLILMLFVTGAVVSFGQIRSFVPVVRPVYTEKTLSFFRSMSGSMKWLGYDELYMLFKSYESGGHGSGFVYVAADRTNYVITNYHVIAGAQTSTLEFEKEDGSKTVYEKCPIFAWNETLDLAIIAFPEGKRPFTSGLNISTRTLEDGMDVWTAGFPGLISDPVWQLGKGNITNSSARIAELITPEITTLIQHSAQVDAGNSGGPLLIADRTKTGGYDMIGINTWKVTGRQAANVSIPASVIRDFIEKTRTQGGSGTGGTRTALESRGRGFIMFFTSEDRKYGQMIDYISHDCVLEIGEKALTEVLTKAPSSVRDEIIGSFSGFSPFKGIRMAISYYLLENINRIPESRNSTLSAVDWEARENLPKVPVKFVFAGTEITSYWVYEYDKWRLVSFPLTDLPRETKKNEAGQSDIRIERPYNLSITAGSILPSDSVDAPTWIFGFNASINDFFVYALELGIRSQVMTDIYYDEATYYFFHMNFVFRFQVPVKTGFLSFIPYASVGAGGEFSFSSSVFNKPPIVGMAGLQLVLGESPSYILGCEYQMHLIKILDSNRDISQFYIYVAVGF